MSTSNISKLIEYLNNMTVADMTEVKYHRVLSDSGKAEGDGAILPYLSLLSNAMSLGMKSKDSSQPFVPMWVMADGQRTAAIEDFTSADLSALREIVDKDVPEIIMARLCDILWLRESDYISAQRAVNSYINLSEQTFSPMEWTKCVNYIRRANDIACKLGKQNASFQQVTDYINEKISLLNGTDPLFLSIELINIQIANKQGNYNTYLAFIDKIIADEFTSMHNEYRITNAVNTKINLLKLTNRQGNINETWSKIAHYYINQADRIVAEKQPGSDLRAIVLYEKSIPYFRKGKFTENEKEVRRKLEPLKKKQLAHMATISNSIDISDTVREIEDHLIGKNFEECLIYLSQVTPFFTKEDLERDVINKLREYPLSHLFSKTTVDRDGRTIIHMPNLDLKDPAKDRKTLELHMHNEAAFMERTFAGIGLRFIISYINNNFEYTEDALDFIFKNNAIIPEDRKKILRFGVFLGLSGKWYESLHILTPQVENIFREIAAECGAITTTYEDDRTEQAKTLSSVFELPELVESFDEDVLFVFKGLLNEKAGSNLRNRITHGIMSEIESKDEISIYFLCACIRLFSWYSPECLSLYHKAKEDSSK